MPPFDSIELSGHITLRGEQRGYTETQVRPCIERPDHSGNVQSAVDIYIKEADIVPRSSRFSPEATGNLDTGSFAQGVRPE
jgi:hypothetical protein